MSFDVRIRRAAEYDIAKAQAWYDTQQAGLGRRFYREVMSAIDRLGESPFIYATIYRDVRRAIVRHFPFLVWYRVTGQTVRILAVTHGVNSILQNHSNVFDKYARHEAAVDLRRMVGKRGRFPFNGKRGRYPFSPVPKKGSK